MEYLAKKSFSFLQDFAFTSINNETCTNTWNTLQKSRFLFCKIVHFSNINSKSYTNKWNILQKSRFPFGKIVYLQVLIINHILILNHILINGISCKKVDFFFARLCIY